MNNTELVTLPDAEILALTIYGEARGEPVEGQIAVGCVIRNRASNEGVSYKSICWSANQFSCWNSNDSNYPLLVDLGRLMIAHDVLNNDSLSQCMWIAMGIVNNSILDNTNGARNYLTTKLYNSRSVVWSQHMKVSAVRGSQTFLV